MTELGQHIRAIRGLRSQEEFAAIVGTSRGVISLWESDKQTPGYRHARRLVELGLDPALLLPTPSPTQATTKAQKGAA